MKKALSLIFCIALVFSFAGQLNAQSWLTYDASKLPSETGDDPFDLTDVSSEYPGANFVEEIMQDPDNPSNYILKYVQPDDTSAAADGEDAKYMYRYYMDDSWTGTSFTIVTRMKSLGVDTLDRIIDIQFRNGNAGLRDELRITPEDGTVEFSKSDAEATLPEDFNFNEWHTYRIAVEGSEAGLFIDEADTAALTTTMTSSTDDNYVKFGDESGATMGGYMDYFLLDTTDAYGPGEGAPLPEVSTVATIVVPSGGDLQAAVESAQDGDLIELVDGGEYEGFDLDSKMITVKAEDDASVKPTITSDINIMGTDAALEVNGLELDGGNENSYAFNLEGSLENAHYLKVLNSEVHSWSKTFLRANRAPYICDSIIVDNSIIHDIGAYDLIHGRGELGVHYISLTNSTFYKNVDSFMRTERDTVIKVVIDHCTFDNAWSRDDAQFMDVDGATEGSKFVFTNNIVTNAGSAEESAGDMWSFSDAMKDTIKNVRIYNVNADTANDWSYREDFSEVEIQYAYAANGDLSLPQGSPLLTAGTDGGQIGDPRWGTYTPGEEIITHWKLDDGSGTTATEEIAGLDGTLHNMEGTEWADGIDGSALNIGAGNDSSHVTVPHEATIDFDSTQSFSISLWVKADPVNYTDPQAILMKGSFSNDPATGHTGKHYQMEFKDGEVRFAVDDDMNKSQLGASIPYNYPIDQWAHVVAVRDQNADSLKLYLNGEFLAGMPDATEGSISENIPLYIGNAIATDTPLRGMLDDIRMYNYALDDGEVMNLFDSYNYDKSKTIVFVVNPEKTNDAGVNPDQPLINNLESKGYDVVKFHNSTLSIASEASMDTLNELADLVIIGRSTASSSFGPPHRSRWNSVKTPMICLSPWAARSQRMNWFNSSDAVHYNDAEVLDANITAPNDPVFDALETSDYNADASLPWWTGQYDVIDIKDGGNANVLARSTVDSTIIFARFEPYTQFYSGAGDYPAGYRSMIGNGNDDDGGPLAFNYFAYTDPVKEVFYREVAHMIAKGKVEQPGKNKEIVFVSLPDKYDEVRGQHADQLHIDKLREQGYKVTTFYNSSLETASQATMDTLNNADLVIVGRSTSSGDFGDIHRNAWNSVKAPLMVMHPYVARSQRMGMFDTEDATHYNENEGAAMAYIEEPNDPVFKGVTPTDNDSLPWIMDQYDVVVAKDAGNGEVLARGPDSNIVFARFEPWEEYYLGAGDRPAGHRTVIGNGNDDLETEAGETDFNYYNFTDESETVWLNEVTRMTTLSNDIPQPQPEGDIVFVSREDGEHIDASTGEHSDMPHINMLRDAGYNVTTYYHSTLAAATQDTLDILLNADLIIVGRSTASSAFGPPNKTVWNNLPVPLITLHPYTVRMQRLNWFDTDACTHYDSVDAVMEATIWDAKDPVFSDLVDATGETIPWAVGPYDVVETQKPGNAQLLATSAVDTNIVYARFEPGTEFYDGAEDVATHYRTYIGNGNDDMETDAGETLFNYNNFTDESGTVFMREVRRMVELSDVEVGVEEEKEDGLNIPDSYSLSDNYPNPFNPVTHFKYQLPKQSHVKVRIYNLLGQHVKTVVDKNMQAGTHTITFDAGNLASGVYFYQIRAGSYTNVKKMLLLK